MNKQQLNSLVVEYQNGNDNAMEGIFRAVNPLIEKASRELEIIVNDVTKFDCRMILKIKRLTITFSEEKHDFLSAVKALISNEKSDFIKRRSKHHEEVSMEFLAEPKGDKLGYQFEDPLARVEEDVLFKERITLLAQGDNRKATVLNEWSKGANDKAISEVLAHQFGGKPSGHRTFIKRFKTDCRTLLAKETTSLIS